MIDGFTKDAKIVVYQAETFDEDPETLMGEYVENPTTSIWLREDGREFPIFSHSEFGSWFNSDPQYSDNVDENTVSEQFIEGVGHFFDPYPNGIGGVDPDLWEEMSDTEHYIIGMLREKVKNGLQDKDPQNILISICEQKATE